jgi:hypothetical protein
VSNGVVASRHALDLHAQDLTKQRRLGSHERALRDLRRFGEPRVVRRKINVANDSIPSRSSARPICVSLLLSTGSPAFGVKK